MRIQFCGATRTTTGSMYLLEINGQQILLECGLYQGRRDDSMEPLAFVDLLKQMKPRADVLAPVYRQSAEF